MFYFYENSLILYIGNVALFTKYHLKNITTKKKTSHKDLYHLVNLGICTIMIKSINHTNIYTKTHTNSHLL